MTAGELMGHWRGDVFDTAQPYLWSETEAWTYMLDAYRMFLRLTGGVADISSAATQLEVTTGEPTAALHPSILRIMSAYRESDGNDVLILNQTDLVASMDDFGYLVKSLNKPRPGVVNAMIIGKQKDTACFPVLPMSDDVIQLSIYRTCLVNELTEESTFDDIDDEHVLHLATWMKHRAFRKDDVEVQNLAKADAYATEFRNYCSFVGAELARKKHKTRVVAYGGL